MPHNGFIYEARMDMMENSGHCHNYMPSPFVASLPIDMNPDWEEKVVTEKEVVWQPGAKFYF